MLENEMGRNSQRDAEDRVADDDCVPEFVGNAGITSLPWSITSLHL